MSRTHIAFTDYHIPHILNGEKYITARYGWDSDEIQSGDRVDLVGPRREVFATATILWETTMTIQDFVDLDFDGHVKYQDAEHMIENMNVFYDAELTPQTELTVISFDADYDVEDLEDDG